MKDMVKLICVLIFLGLFMAVGTWLVDSTSAGKEEGLVATIGGIDVVEIEGCEYLKCTGYLGYKTYTHKGNCKNKIHYK